MKPLFRLSLLVVFLFTVASCTGQQTPKANNASPTNPLPNKDLPEPSPPSSKISKAIGWPNGKTPVAPKGFTVTKYADNLKHARWLYQLPNGDVLLAEGDANRILLFRDTNNDGLPDLRETFIDGLNQPCGMLLLKDYFYVANTDGVLRFIYQNGQTKINGTGKKILDLPTGGHWTRTLAANADGSKLYIGVGSSSDHAEDGLDAERRRANVLEINPDGSGERVFASGMRNPVGLAFEQTTHTLWTVVNERDNLGDNLVPDYLTSVSAGQFYGWPFVYYGSHADPRVTDKMPSNQKVSTPDLQLGAHVAPLGLAFYTGNGFPSAYHQGAFIAEHGSWNRSQFAGYKVVFVPFKNGKPSGAPEDFLTGFIADANKGTVYGRPVGLCVLKDGSMLVADDGADVIWRVAVNP